MPDREKVMGHLNDCMEASRRDNTWVFVRKDIVEDALALLKEQGCAKIKEPDCRICAQSHCKYYHESRKPTECKSYVRMEGR